MSRKLTVDLADETTLSGAHSKALSLYTHVLWDFRVEGWQSLLMYAVRMALRCAYLTASVQEYIQLCLEYASFSNLPLGEGRRTVANLAQVFNVSDRCYPCALSSQKQRFVLRVPGSLAKYSRLSM